ncbi:hypothetical protein RN001_005664 [Aquatica leii]|uniref:Uncharacterized protein n=1 Tax=Aquatica leii TaxID=1421715 RepID=A0AAN7SS39_9COLE|nr:hypothetical protein RN001_005664 [Aquatica leii]
MDEEETIATATNSLHNNCINEKQNVQNVQIQKRKRGRPPKTFSDMPTRKSARTRCKNEELEKSSQAETNHKISEDPMVKYNNNKKNNYLDHIIEEASNRYDLRKDALEVFKKTTLSIPVQNVSLNSCLVKKYNLPIHSNGYDKDRPGPCDEQNRKQMVENENKTLKIPKIKITMNNSHPQNDVITSEDETTDKCKESLPIKVTPPSKSNNHIIPSSNSPTKPNISNTLSKESYLSKVLVNHYPAIKPFNITINVGAINQERKVEFSGKPKNEAFSPTRVSVQKEAYERSLVEYPESVPELQFYSGDWFFDITDEDLYKVSTSDTIFKTAHLTLTRNDLFCTSPTLTTTSKLSVESEKDSFAATTSVNSAFQFIKPTLPPAKRPPTRKKKETGSLSSALSSTESLSSLDKPLDSELSTTCSTMDDDVISIYSAWSIKTSDLCTNLTKSEPEVNPNESVMNQNEPNYLTTTLPSCAIKKIEFPRIISTEVDNRNLPDTFQKQNILQWLETTERPKHYADFSTIPLVFKPLCYFFYTYGYCTNRFCPRKHSINRLNRIEVTKLNHESFMDAYNYSKNKSKLYWGFFNTFISVFVRTNNVTELVGMVGAIMETNSPEPILYVKEVIAALQSTGRSFAKSIEEILIVEGEKNLALSDILFEIAYEQKQDLCSNWYLIEKLCRYRNSRPLNHLLIDDLVKTCYSEENIELSINVVRDIFMQNCVDLTEIDKLVFSHFIFFLKSKNLIEEVNILLSRVPGRVELQNTCKVTSFPENNPAWEQPRACINLAVENSQKHNFNLEPNNLYQSFEPPTLTTDVPCNQTLQGNSHSNYEFPEWADNLFGDAKQGCNDNIVSDVTRVEDAQYTNTNSNAEHMYTDSDSASSQESVAESTLQNAISTSTSSSLVTDKSLESSELSDYEMKKLSEVIASNNIEELISMYNQFKNSSFNNSFVMNVIGFLKQKNMPLSYYLVHSLIEGLEQQNSHFAYINNAESTLYLLAVNIIALLKQNKDYRDAARLLFKFNDNLDNLLKVQWFRSIQKHKLSVVGKYLYFCQIFTRGEYLQEALTILKSPDLKLLNPISSWTLPHNETFDNEFRNDVVNEFIKTALKENLKIAKEIILHMITCKDNITELSLWRYFDELILGFLNNHGMYVTDLVNMLPNILQGWYKYLKHSNMRGLLVKLTFARIPERQLLLLYNKCLKQRIYNKVKGNESTIIFKTDMTVEEIFVTIRYYLYKLEQIHSEVQEVTLLIKIPEELSTQPDILINSGCRMQETKERILTVLARCFPTAIVARCNTESQIIIRPDQIKLCVEHYRKMNEASKAIWVRQSAVEKLTISDPVPTTSTFNFSNTLCSR